MVGKRMVEGMAGSAVRLSRAAIVVAEVAKRLTSQLDDDGVIGLPNDALLLFRSRAAELDHYSVAAE